MPEATPIGSLKASCCKAAGGRVTLARPMSFWRGFWMTDPTVDSAKAIVLDVPSVTALSDLDCCQAKSPVVFTEERFGTEVGLPLRMLVVVPIEPK